MIADKLDLIPVKELLFSYFNGQIKSFGEWGGDFVLVAAAETPTQVRNYFFK